MERPRPHRHPSPRQTLRLWELLPGEGASRFPPARLGIGDGASRGTSGREWAESDPGGRKGDRCALPLRPVLEEALLRRDPQEDRVRGSGRPDQGPGVSRSVLRAGCHTLRTGELDRSPGGILPPRGGSGKAAAADARRTCRTGGNAGATEGGGPEQGPLTHPAPFVGLLRNILVLSAGRSGPSTAHDFEGPLCRDQPGWGRGRMLLAGFEPASKAREASILDH